MKTKTTTPKTTKTATTEIETSLVKGSQDYNYKHIFTLAEYKIKVSIRRDSYDKQSHAIIYVWHKAELTWNVITAIPYQNMRTLQTVNVYSDKAAACWDFASDENLLIQNAKQILF